MGRIENNLFIAGSQFENCTITASIGDVQKQVTIAVLEPPRLVRLNIINSESRLYYGECVWLSVEGSDQYENSIAVDNVEWSSSSGSILENYFQAGYQSERVAITAQSGNITDIIWLQVFEPPRLVEVAIAPPDSTEINPGKSYTFKAYGLDQYGNRYELDQPRWSIKVNPHLGSINQDGRFKADSERFGKCTIQVQVDEFTATQKIVIPRILTEIKIFPTHSRLQPEEYECFTVEGYDQSGLSVELGGVSWRCDRGGKINQQGIFRAGYDARSVMVRATYGELTDSVEVELLPVLRRLELRPSSAIVEPGCKQQFKVIGRDQFREEIDPGSVVWNATGAIISQAGLYQADHTAKGEYWVRVTSTTAPKWTRTPRHIFRTISIISEIASFIFKLLAYEVKALSGDQHIEEVLMPADQDAQSTTSDLVNEEQNNFLDSVKGLQSLILNHQGFLYKQLGKLFSKVSRFCGQEANARVSEEAVILIPAVLRELKIEPNNARLTVYRSQKFQAIGYDQQECETNLPKCITWHISSEKINIDLQKSDTVEIWVDRFVSSINLKVSKKSIFARLATAIAIEEERVVEIEEISFVDMNSDEEYFSLYVLLNKEDLSDEEYFSPYVLLNKEDFKQKFSLDDLLHKKDFIRNNFVVLDEGYFFLLRLNRVQYSM